MRSRFVLASTLSASSLSLSLIAGCPTMEMPDAGSTEDAFAQDARALLDTNARDARADVLMVDAQVSGDANDAPIETVDASEPDAGVDANEPDAFVVTPDDAFIATPDAFVGTDAFVVATPDAFVATPDAFVPTPDAFVPRDAAVPPDAFVPSDAGCIVSACNDGNACTTDSCASGVCQNTPVSIDDGNVCTTDACNPATGISHAPLPAGTNTAAQTTGDCRIRQCDGLGGTVNAIDNSDLPVDGNQCTNDICTAGAPMNPSLVAGSPCAQSGGTMCNGSGICVAGPPSVVSTTPADSSSAVAGASIAVTFSDAMAPASLTAQTAAGACTGSVQVSLNDFASCIALASAAPAMSAGNTIATFTAAPGLLVNRSYKIRVTTAAQSAGAIALAGQYTSGLGFTTGSPDVHAGSVVIAQVFGGGAGSGAPFNADYVVLHNRGTVPVTMTNWSLQYASATGTTWVAASFTGTIAPSGYFLVSTTAAGATGAALPTPDASTASFNMAQAAGKVALVSNMTVLPAGCPTGASIVDFVGYGPTASCSEGSAPAPAPSATLAVFRRAAACADVGLNSVDFSTAAPAPLNSASAADVCALYVQNESGTALEADYCNVQFPTSLNVAAGAASPLVYGRIFDLGTTEAAGANAAVRAQIGFGPLSANPEYQAGWTWTNATYNTQVGNDDEYQATFTAPATGSYRYVYRVSLDHGATWTTCDIDGAGSNAGLSFDFSAQAELTVP